MWPNARERTGRGAETVRWTRLLRSSKWRSAPACVSSVSQCLPAGSTALLARSEGSCSEGCGARVSVRSSCCGHADNSQHTFGARVEACLLAGRFCCRRGGGGRRTGRLSLERMRQERSARDGVGQAAGPCVLWCKRTRCGRSSQPSCLMYVGVRQSPDPLRGRLTQAPFARESVPCACDPQQ